MFFSPFEQFDSVTWVILYFFCVMFFCIFSMSLYVALALYPLVAVISNHLDTYPTPINLSYMWSFGSIAGRINPKSLFSAALVVAPTQTPTFVENVGIWVDDHPVVTVVIISSIIFLGSITIIYFVAPHLLGITAAGAAGAVDPLKQLTTQLADAKSEVIVQQGLRVAAEARLGEAQNTIESLTGQLTEATGALGLNEALRVRHSMYDPYVWDLLVKVKAEGPGTVHIDRTHLTVDMSVARQELIGQHILDAAQAASNILTDKPLGEVLPEEVVFKFIPLIDTFVKEVIKVIFG